MSDLVPQQCPVRGEGRGGGGGGAREKGGYSEIKCFAKLHIVLRSGHVSSPVSTYVHLCTQPNSVPRVSCNKDDYNISIYGK